MISRKKIIQTAAMTAAMLSAGSQIFAKDHEHKSDSTEPESDGKYTKAMQAAVKCRLSAEICIAHCISEMGKGNKDLEQCARTASDVKATCEAFITMASTGSGFTKQMAELCIKICKAREKECKKHASHHSFCKDCMTDCRSCAKELAKV